jgi:hypothetical protein
LIRRARPLYSAGVRRDSTVKTKLLKENGAASQEVTHSAVAVYRLDYTLWSPKVQLTKTTIFAFNLSRFWGFRLILPDFVGFYITWNRKNLR